MLLPLNVSPPRGEMHKALKSFANDWTLPATRVAKRATHTPGRRQARPDGETHAGNTVLLRFLDCANVENAKGLLDFAAPGSNRLESAA